MPATRNYMRNSAWFCGLLLLSLSALTEESLVSHKSGCMEYVEMMIGTKTSGQRVRRLGGLFIHGNFRNITHFTLSTQETFPISVPSILCGSQRWLQTDPPTFSGLIALAQSSLTIAKSLQSSSSGGILFHMHPIDYALTNSLKTGSCIWSYSRSQNISLSAGPCSPGAKSYLDHADIWPLRKTREIQTDIGPIEERNRKVHLNVSINDRTDFMSQISSSESIDNQPVTARNYLFHFRYH